MEHNFVEIWLFSALFLTLQPYTFISGFVMSLKSQISVN